MSTKTIWIVVLLIGSYIACQIIADVSATKMIVIGGIVLPAGSLIFTVTFTLRDLIHKRLGKQWARTCIIAAAGFNLLMAGYFMLGAAIPAPVWFELGDAWDAIFAIVPAITLGSIAAELVSELLDTEVYHLWRQHIEERWHTPQWMRVLVSNVISLPVDSFVFALLAFVILPPLFGAEALPLSIALGLVGGQIIWKAIITVVSMPAIYFVKDEKIKFA